MGGSLRSKEVLVFIPDSPWPLGFEEDQGPQKASPAKTRSQEAFCISNALSLLFMEGRIAALSISLHSIC